MKRLDCIVIGHNEPPFEEYEAWVRKVYGVESEAYRDLRFNFVDIGGRKRTYVDLLNDISGGEQDHPYRSGDIPHLAAAYLTQFLRRAGFTAQFINLFQPEKERLAAMLAESPLCVAITTTLYVTNEPAIEIVRFVRACSSSTAIVIGGPLIANHDRNLHDGAFDAALRDLGADYYVIEGQGEQTLASLVGTLQAGGDPADVPNLVFLKNRNLHRTPRIPEANDVSANALDWEHLVKSEAAHTLQTRTARSCAFSCAFCNYPTRAGKLATQDPDVVQRELESMRALGAVKNLIFIDDTFNVPIGRFKDLCRMMHREQFAFHWFSYFRCSNADEEAIDLMAESGCKGVFLGIESGSPAILTNMNKHANTEQYAWAMEKLRAAGILTFASFIVGFPGETAGTVDETRRFILQTRPDFYRAQLWYNEPGTPIRRQQEKYGIEGDGFVWRHKTMESLEAMDHIDQLFLTINESTWLPQWSFDFWIIPYLNSRGITRECFDVLMRQAHELLRLEIAGVTGPRKEGLQKQRLRDMKHVMDGNHYPSREAEQPFISSPA